MAGNPRRIAEFAAWATTPAEGIVQRYLRAGAAVELTKLANLLSVWPVAVRTGAIEHARESLELWLRQERAEPLAHQPFADVVVTIAVRAQRGLRVVCVEETQAVEADSLVELLEQGVEHGAIGDVDA